MFPPMEGLPKHAMPQGIRPARSTVPPDRQLHLMDAEGWRPLRDGSIDTELSAWLSNDDDALLLNPHEEGEASWP